MSAYENEDKIFEDHFGLATFNADLIASDFAKDLYRTIISNVIEICYVGDLTDLNSIKNRLNNAINFVNSIHIDRDSIESTVFSLLDRVLDDTSYRGRIDHAIRNRNAKVTAARDKAQKSIYDETPDFEEEGYAIWNSKNGPRKVTVVSIDEPNNRAKINTDKGATLYVPLDSLDKDADYSALD